MNENHPLAGQEDLRVADIVPRDVAAGVANPIVTAREVTDAPPSLFTVSTLVERGAPGDRRRRGDARAGRQRHWARWSSRPGLTRRWRSRTARCFIKGLILKGGFVNARMAQTKRDTITFLQLVAAGAVKTPDLDGGLYSPTEAPKVYDRVLAADRSLVAPVLDWEHR